MSIFPEALAQLPDPRRAHRRVHGLVALLQMAVAAMLYGARGLYAIAQWGNERADWERRGVKLTTAYQGSTKKQHGRIERREIWVLWDAELAGMRGARAPSGSRGPIWRRSTGSGGSGRKTGSRKWKRDTGDWGTWTLSPRAPYLLNTDGGRELAAGSPRSQGADHRGEGEVEAGLR